MPKKSDHELDGGSSKSDTSFDESYDQSQRDGMRVENEIERQDLDREHKRRNDKARELEYFKERRAKIKKFPGFHR